MVKVRDQEMRHTQLLKASQMAKTQLQELVPNTSDKADEHEGIFIWSIHLIDNIN